MFGHMIKIDEQFIVHSLSVAFFKRAGQLVIFDLAFIAIETDKCPYSSNNFGFIKIMQI